MSFDSSTSNVAANGMHALPPFEDNSDVTKIGNITGRIKFKILNERKRLILFTPLLDYTRLSEGSEVEFPATLVLINSTIHNPEQSQR